MSDSSPKLAPSQGNALVYSTLVGFAAVGFYAGYRVKNKVDFLSGIKTQSGALPFPVLHHRVSPY